MRIDEKTAVDFLLKNDNYIILTHQNPDGDTLGSAFALMGAFKKLGKKSMVLNEKSIPEKFDYLRLDNDKLLQNPTVISVDIADKKLMGALEEQFGSCTKLCIDHHPTNTEYAELLLIDEKASATCEVIYRLIKSMGIIPDEKTATALYTGISTDTGCFRYSNVTGNTHRYAGELIELGARHSFVNVVMFETKSPQYFSLERMCLEKMKILFDGKVAMIALTQAMYRESGADESCAEAIASIPRQVEGVKIGITLKEKEDGSYKISFRTHEPFDASEICKKLGGGGHSRAAGCQLESMSIDKAEKIIIKCLEEVMSK